MPREADHCIRCIHTETFQTWFKEHVSFLFIDALFKITKSTIIIYSFNINDIVYN